jgi:hypothetical protein
MPKICDFETCRKFANYGESYCKPIRCREHKDEYKIANMLCINDGCKISASYNFQGLQSKFCFEHKTNEMVDIKNKKCIYQGCKLQSSFNYDGEKNGLYCSVHKKDDMINIKKKTCLEPNCTIIPIFNYDGEKGGKYCSIHKLNSMIDVMNNNTNCLFENCKKRANYNYECEIIGRFCGTHKLQNMINIQSKTCEYIDCKKIPNFNFSGEKNGCFCKEHSLLNMIDVKNKSCEFDGCIKQPCYNFQGEKKARFCVNHRLINMIDVHNSKCKANFCLGSLANKKYKGYCASCYQQLFPTDPLTLQMNSKTKEIAVRDYINLNFDGFQHDKPLWTGNCDCTHRRRIDHRKLIGNTLLCIETDENQHKNYNDKDEEIRYDDLFMLHSGKFVFIRFNPDKFKDKNCKSVNPMLYTRLPVLKEEIEKQISRIKKEENIELLEIIKLYYDEIKN